MRTLLQSSEHKPGQVWHAFVLCREITRSRDFSADRVQVRQRNAKKFGPEFLGEMAAKGHAHLVAHDAGHRLLVIDVDSCKRESASRGEGLVKTIKREYHARDVRDRLFRDSGMTDGFLDSLKKIGFEPVAQHSRLWRGGVHRAPPSPCAAPRRSKRSKTACLDALAMAAAAGLTIVEVKDDPQPPQLPEPTDDAQDACAVQALAEAVGGDDEDDLFRSMELESPQEFEDCLQVDGLTC
eukprot:m51a1_g8793 hypothetical protein (239) ;mRNA; f:236152-237254